MLTRRAIFTVLLALSANPYAKAETDSPSYLWGRGISLPVANLTLGGYINASFEQQEKLKSHASADDISFFVTWTPHARLRFFSEIELEDWISSYGVNDDIYESIRVERLYADVLINESLSLRLGKFLTPVGRWNVTHAGPLVWTTTRPVITEKLYTQEHLSGAMLTKKLELANHAIDISVYGDNAEELDVYKEELETENAFGGRINIELSEQLQLGASYLNFAQAADETALARDQVFGADLLWQQNNYEVLMEFVYRHAKDFQGDKKGLYLQAVAPLVQKLFVVGRYEYLDDNNKLIEDNAQVGVIGLTWRPYTPLALKVEYRLGHNNDYIAPSGFFSSLAVFF
jgi:hypothetical protein